MDSNPVMFALTLTAALGSGLVAGVFFAFSTFVMRALARLPAAQGIAAMQAINVCVMNRWTMGAFLGTAAVCAAAAALSLARWNEPGVAYALGGSALYLLGCVLVTGVFNVPRNESLASIAPDDDEAPAFWARYVATWTLWNHVRTAMSAAAAVVLTVALT